MKKIDNFYYSKLNYHNYQTRLKELLNNENLQKLNIKHTILGKTHYNYDIDCITIGNGNKELFIVGGTHGSEIISTDFILNFINNLPDNKDFSKSNIKLVIIPLQNPEGFDISTNTMKDIDDDNFTNVSYEYFLKYKVDSLITNILKDLTILFEDKFINLDLNSRIIALKNFIKTNPHFIYLTKLTPNLKKFNDIIFSFGSTIDNDNFLPAIKIYVALMNICNQQIIEYPNNYMEEIYNYFMLELHNLIETVLLIEITNLNILPRFSNKNYINENKKLHQLMFKDSLFDGLKNKKLTYKTKEIYEKYKHPKGSQITHDSTGLNINLNANTKTNPGIDIIKNTQTKYGLSSRSNIKNYTPGPLGVPTLDVNNFTFAHENLVLENLIKDSLAKGSYLATLLYHGTGGLIYYKPYHKLMNDDTYQSFLEFNLELAHIYQIDTGYKILNESDFTGYGDYLRRTYPGVLLIELSKMGGNPLGPYGDINNTYEVFEQNTKALSSVIKKLTKRN